MKIIVIGTGYVGLVSATCFAKLGHQVIAIDKDIEKINALKNCNIPIYEENLQNLLKEVKKNISFSSNLQDLINESDAIFIAVGTPQGEGGNADLTFVLNAAKEIAKYSNSYKVIITKSTVPVGTGNLIAKTIKSENRNLDFSIVSNPEFLREGNAIEDFMNPDRIVIGSSDLKAKKILSEIYKNFADEKILHTDVATAELIKYASNSFLATKIAFINEMADLCEKSGANIFDLKTGVGLDLRIGGKFLNPGPGFGGSCFPKDILALLNIAKQHETNLSIVDSVVKSNDLRKDKIAKQIINFFQDKISQKTIAFLGLAFKANTDDIRCSPSIDIIKKLSKLNCKIHATDPQSIENAKKEMKSQNIFFFENCYEATKDADLIVIATEWSDYKNLDLKLLKKTTKATKIFDLRNILDANKARQAGFEYYYIGGNFNYEK